MATVKTSFGEKVKRKQCISDGDQTGGCAGFKAVGSGRA